MNLAGSERLAGDDAALGAISTSRTSPDVAETSAEFPGRLTADVVPST